ncbi:MAG: hypothetical protein ACPLRM_02515 [Anaerolineae bacterium]
MRRFWKIAGIATLAVVLGVTALGVVALAQWGSTETSGWNFRQKMHEAIASILGISVEKYDAAVESAKEQVLKQAVEEGWLTQKQADALKERFEMQWEGPWMGKGFRFWGGCGCGGPGGTSLFSIAADKLGMSLDDLIEEFKQGKSISDVAKEKGIDPQTIADEYLAKYKEKLDEAVKAERITQKQADLMLNQMKEAVTEQLDAACGGCWAGGFMGRGGRGRFGGFPGRGFPGWGEF